MGLGEASSIGKRFWKVGGMAGLLVLTIVVVNFFLPADKAFDRHMYGHDFLPFYTAGQLIRTGRANELYDAQATRELEHQTCASAGLVIRNEYGAFLNPPFAALPAAWLARWPYEQALAVWTAMLAVFLAAAMVLLVKMLPEEARWRVWGLAPLLMFTSLPVWQAALHAQNTFFSLLVLAAAVSCWRAQRPMAAGLIAGLLLFKPQLGIVVAGVLAICLGRRAIAGVCMTGAVLVAINLIALPGTLGGYVYQLPMNLRAIQELPNYTWHRHVTFLAAWRMLLQGHVGALPSSLTRMLALICTGAVAVPLGAVIWRQRNCPAKRDRVIAAAIAATPLLMPYYMDYDLTLLAVAAVLCAGDAIRCGVERSVLLAWVAFYCVVEINPAVAGATRFIPDVAALAVLTGVLIRRAGAAAAEEEIAPAGFTELALAA